MVSQPQIIIIGGESRLANACKRIYPHEVLLLDKSACDITSQTSLEKAFKTYAFSYVINCAAITDISTCENDPKRCLDVNTVGVFLLNDMCKKYSKKLIHISSDYACSPMNTYGMSKYVSEKIVDKNTLVVRTNFYDEKTYIIKQLLDEKPIKTFSNVYFNPVSINRLVNEIYKNKNSTGILNVFSDKKISYTSFARRCSKVFHTKFNLINPIKYTNKGNLYIRPMNSTVKSDIVIPIDIDLVDFKTYLHNEH